MSDEKDRRAEPRRCRLSSKDRKMGNLARFSASVLAVICVAGVGSGGARGADAGTYTQGVFLEMPVFQTIDQNGVDLTNGMLRLQSPQLTVGSGDNQVVFGLQWFGRGWGFVGVPTLSFDNPKDKYIVTFEGQSYEFHDYTQNLAERNPKRGTSLECYLTGSQSNAQYCTFVGRHGEIVHFLRAWGPQYSSDYGYETMGMGNMGMTVAYLMSPKYGFSQFYSGYIVGHDGGSYGFDSDYNVQTKTFNLNGQHLTIVTPNHNGNDDEEHYLIPKSTTQTITNDLGMVWSYTVNGNREITSYQQPGGIGAISYLYDGDHRVTSVTTPDGVWGYTYSTPGSNRVVTVTAPNGEKTQVTSHKDKGYLVQIIEGYQVENRTTNFTHNAEDELVNIAYPAGNSLDFEYDDRGNVTLKRSNPAPGSGDTALEWTASYPAICTNRVTCNSPTQTKDPNGNITEFEYAATSTVSTYRLWAGLPIATYAYGDYLPSVVKYPAAAPGQPRRIVSYQYARGVVSRSASCIAIETCTGTSDEVVVDPLIYNWTATGLIQPDTYGFGNMISGTYPVSIGETVTNNGVTRVSCRLIDSLGQLVAEIPPSANVSDCGAYAAGAPQAVTANPPEAGHSKTSPTDPP